MKRGSTASQGSPDRHTFLHTLAAMGAGIALAAAARPRAAAASGNDAIGGGDRAILIAAEIAEALAVTTYSTIIATATFYPRLVPHNQRYLQAAREEEMSHYLLLQRATGAPSPYLQFFYPRNMFAQPHLTLNTLVALEDAFIAAYLIGVKDLSTPALRLTAARIMGIESDHRTLIRRIAPDLATADGGPLLQLTGLQGVAESIDPPNNNGYERTLGWTSIDQAIKALLPFVDQKAAHGAGFDTTKRYPFQPFAPSLPNPQGAF